MFGMFVPGFPNNVYNVPNQQKRIQHEIILIPFARLGNMINNSWRLEEYIFDGRHLNRIIDNTTNFKFSYK